MIQIPNYEIDETLFSSRGTRVFRAHNVATKQTVILRTSGVEGDIKSQESRLAFGYEVLEMFDHPNIVKTIEMVQGVPIPCMVMEDSQGIDLRRYVEQFEDKQLPVQIFLDIAIQLSGALDVIHHAQVIHKDLHPGNIIINPDTGVVQIIDFGLASLLTREQPVIVEPDRLEGVLSYISPEQTGRMNRALDYRSDFYTLGVTFYQLLTGALPFEADDALGMVYAHMATEQVNAAEKRPSIPNIIAMIIDKMMMKNAEDRYQSAFGLKYDLERCQRLLKKNGTIDDFLLATEDVSSRFCIPQTLYGRNEEIGLLLQCYDQALTGTPQLLTISGYSGIGKSALVHEIYKPIAANNGVFISGKFDQFQQNTPYSAIKNALSSWLKQELRLPEARLLTQKKRLIEALGTNAGILTEFMSEFEHLLGAHSPPVVLGSQETLARFVLVFQAFLKTVTEQRPWVLFIDDIQWADRGTLNLLPELLNESGCRLLLLLAYRNNEVDTQHPAQLMLNRVEGSGASVESIQLEPLKEHHIRLLITDTFHRTQADVEVLAEMVIAKTGGNPFFAIEFLKALYRKGLVQFDIKQHCWTWDLSLIENESITDNVVELMLERMADLPEDTRRLLQIAACVGSHFDLETLSIVCAQPLSEIADSLWPALKEGLLVREGGDWFLGMIGGVMEYKSTESSTLVSNDRPISRVSDYSLSNVTAIQNFIPQCKFLHDRMLQAAYESLEERDRIQTHLTIGWRLYTSFNPQQRKERVFELVEQLNHGAELVEKPEEKEILIDLNSLAAEKAKSSSVWLAVERYSSFALQLLGSNAWDVRFELSFKLLELMAEAAYINGEFDSASERYNTLVERAKDPLDKAELLTQRLVQSIGRSDYSSALTFGRKALYLLGITIPSDEEDLNNLIKVQQAKLDIALQKCPINTFHNLPECKDRTSQLAIYLLVNFGLAGMLMQQQKLVVVGVQKSLLTTIEHGRTDSTLVTLTSYGLMLVNKGDYEAAAEAGDKARELLAIYPNCREAASVWNGIAVALNHLKHPLMESYDAYVRGFESGIQAGELARAGVCYSAKVSIKASAGYPLEKTLSEVIEAKEFTAKKSLRVPFIPVYENTWRSYLTNSYLLEDQNFEQENLKAIKESSFKFSLHYFRFEYHFWDEADCETLLSFLLDAYNTYELFKFHFMSVDLYTLTNLVFIRCQREGYFKNKEKELERWQSISTELLDILLKRADLNPPACKHKADLVKAEQLALNGAPFEQTAAFYKKAISGAEDNGFRQYAALANECFGRYLIDIGFDVIAETPINRAYTWYTSWGNKIKVDRLKARYIILSDKSNFNSTSESCSLRQNSRALSHHTANTSHATATSVKSDEALDFQSIVKSMQAISGELDLHNLVESMMKVIMENAGAQVAVLVIQSFKGPEVEAQVDLGDNHSTYLKHIPLEQAKNVPHDLINLTLRMGDNIWLDNACSEGEFIDDKYIAQAKAKSVLCLPISYRNTRIGALYLENNLSTGAFTEGRLSVLKVLLGQAAISLENARLFNEVTGLNAGLEAKVTQRTKDLDEANEELALANKELESFSYTVSHDLKSPLRMIKGFSDILIEDYQNQLDEDAQRILGKVVAGAKSMEELINGLLDLSRMQRKEVNREPLNLSDIANTVVDNLRDTFPDRDVEINIQEGIKVNGDSRMMHSVIENLINNAWKYSGKTDNPKITFSESVRYDDHGRPERLFMVADNGAGFDMTHADKLFSTFQRLHNKSDFEGTGVGLSTVKRIIEKHDGEIWAEAEVNKGATFYFTLG